MRARNAEARDLVGCVSLIEGGSRSHSQALLQVSERHAAEGGEREMQATDADEGAPSPALCAPLFHEVVETELHVREKRTNSGGVDTGEEAHGLGADLGVKAFRCLPLGRPFCERAGGRKDAERERRVAGRFRSCARACAVLLS